MNSEEMEVRRTEYHRMPKYVVQEKQTVRVLRHTPDRVELQIRNPGHYMHASMTPTEARALANKLNAAAHNANYRPTNEPATSLPGTPE